MSTFAKISQWKGGTGFSNRPIIDGDLLRIVSFFLREPLSIAEVILRSNAKFLNRIEYRRDHIIGKREIRQHAASFELAQGKNFSNLIERDKRSRILAAYHFGDFIYGMNYLVALDAPERRRVVLSQARSKPNYTENMCNAFGAKAVSRIMQLICNDTSMATLSALLRRGSCTLVMFCDLPTGSGEVVQVKFMNRAAWFPKGPATLAIVNRTPLLPVINYSCRGINKIDLAPQIESELLPGEGFETGVKRITQQLISYFEGFFVRFPEQWRYLQKLPLYFSKTVPKFQDDENQSSTEADTTILARSRK